MENKTDDQNISKSGKEKYPKLAKAKELAQNQKIRAEKAEAKLKEALAKPTEKETPKNEKEKEVAPSQPEYSLQDIRALADVHDDDVDVLVKFSKAENISISEAKKHTDVKAILRSRAEVRKTAKATNTKGGRRGTSSVSGSSLLNKAEERGEMPEKDADLDKMLDARMKRMQEQSKD